MHYLLMFLLGFVSFPVSIATSAPLPAATLTVPYQQQQPAAPAPLETRLIQLQHRAPLVAFYIHTVTLKENLWKIAAKRGYSVHTLIGCNPDLKTYEVSAGQRILIPSKAGTLHQVLAGDTWERIAARYRIPAEQLQNINSGVTALSPGEFIFIPGRRPLMQLMNEGMRKQYELHALFVSPLGGRLSSFFGKRKHPLTGAVKLHAGIDIAVREGTWVGAAADGVVTVAGSGIGHYGTAVFIDHGNGYETQYGHLSQVFVHPGQHVKARQLIAKSGSTGWSTGPHLHFTIKKDGVPKDPLQYLW